MKLYLFNKMKQFGLKILSVIMALSVLFTTTSFNVDLHYCCNTLVDISIFSEADTCINTTKKTPIKCTIEDESCCTNTTFVRLGDDNLKNDSFKYSFESFTFISTFLDTYINLFESIENRKISFQKYVPPLILKDIIILHETFLI